MLGDPEQIFKDWFGYDAPDCVDVRKFVDGLAEHEPELWSYFYPRWYRNTDRYLSARIPAQSFFICSLDMLGITPTEPTLTEQAIWSTGIQLHKHRFPHYYIAPELFKAVSMSEPPEGMRWDTMKFPHPAAIFMLPRKTLFHPVEGEVSWLAYARIHHDEDLSFHADPHHWQLTNKNDCFMVVWECHESRPSPPSFHVVLTADKAPYISDIAKCFDRESGAAIGDPGNLLDIPMVASEAEFSKLAASLVFRILLAMEARPLLVERGSFTRKYLGSKGKPTEIWNPNIVGREYRIRKEAEGIARAAGWHLRMHWRRGHYKQQAHGPKHELRKTIWIDPYLAGAVQSD
jgi:hypothetical protein